MATRRISYGSWALAGMLAFGSAADAAPFEAPREGPVAFRRDRLSLDVDTMTGLSAELVVLSQGQKLGSAQSRRAVAQMLALALALDPDNGEARSALAGIAKGSPREKVSRRVLERSEARIWNTLAWLQQPEAGADGQALGACLGDIISIADAGHPKAGALLDSGEKGGWKGWVADLGAFEDSQPSHKETVEKMDPGSEKIPASAAKIVLEAASISTPLWTADKTTLQEHLGLVQVQMKATVSPPQEGVVIKPMAFTVDHTLENGQVNRINRNLHGALVKQFGPLPAGSQATLNLGEEISYLPVRDREALSAAAATLLGAALSGKEPTGIVIGKIEADGGFKAVPDLWDRLRMLSKGPGGRLVIPAEAADLMPWILALEDPEFFFKYDVVYASNLTELLERSSKSTASPLTEILSRYQDVRAKGAGVAVGQYITNRFVRQRLIDLSNEAPYFASPKMLAVQASGERPTRIPRKILAFELRRAIQPLEWMKAKAAADIDLTALDKSYDLARAEVDKLERYSENRDLLLKVRDMTTTLRTFSRASRVSAGRDNGPAIIAEAFDQMKKSQLAVIAELNAVIGEPETPEPEE